MATAPLRGVALKIARQNTTDAIQDLDIALAFLADTYDPDRIKAARALVLKARGHALFVSDVMNPKTSTPEGSVAKAAVVRELTTIDNLIGTEDSHLVRTRLRATITRYSTNENTDNAPL